MELDEAAFERLAQATLLRWGDHLEDDGPEGLECEQAPGTLTLTPAGAGTFLLSKHAPLRQLWYSSTLSGASHYAWDGTSRAWLSTRGGDDLATLLADELHQATGQRVLLPAIEAA